VRCGAVGMLMQLVCGFTGDFYGFALV